MDFSSPEQGRMTDLCEHGGESWGSLKTGNFD
jgi:hypothetical protein